MNKKYIACYCRVSTDKREQENSFENQKSYFEREIRREKNNILADIYADEGFTGTKLNNRPEFNRMLQDAGLDVMELYSDRKDKRLKRKHIVYEISDREPKFTEIWIKNTSRFARNTLSFEIITKLRQKGVYIRFIEQNINTKDIGSDLLLKLFQLFDEQDSKDKSLKVSTGIREGAIKGVVATNNRIYGYNYIQSENRLEIIEEEAEVIRKIYELYAEGYGFRRIVNYLDENDIKTREGKVFCKSSIHRILTNEKYIGLNVRMKYTTGRVFSKESYPKIKPVEEWLNTDKKSDKIPPIISDQIFYKCQNLMENKVNRVNQKGVYNGITEYAGLIVCGKCGSSYVSNADRGRKYYNCKTKKLKGIKACNNDNISVKLLDSLVTSENYKKNLKRCKLLYKSYLDEMITFLKNKIDNDAGAEIDKLNNEVKELNSKIDKLLELYLSNNFSKDRLDKLNKEYELQIKEKQRAIEVLRKPNDEIYADINIIEATIQEIENIEIKATYIKEEILKDISQIVIYSKNKIEVTYKIWEKVKILIDKHHFEIYNNELSV